MTFIVSSYLSLSASLIVASACLRSKVPTVLAIVPSGPLYPESCIILLLYLGKPVSGFFNSCEIISLRTCE